MSTKTETKQATPLGHRLALIALATILVSLAAANPVFAQFGGGPGGPTCERTLQADVVAFDQVFYWNRLGVVQPQGMMFALRADVVPKLPDPANPTDPCDGVTLTPGCVDLRADKRPRPMVLRMNAGDCMEITFENLLNPTPVDEEQAATREASVHAMGMQLVSGMQDDGSYVGNNSSSLVSPGGTATYKIYAEAEGPKVLYSTGATTGGEGDGGQLNAGLFGALNIEPRGSIWYRSQVIEADLALATSGTNPDGSPQIDYTARDANGKPILLMMDPLTNEIVHTDLTAIIGGTFTDIYPENPVLPERQQPFREFTIIYHDEIGAVQAFPDFFDDAILQDPLHSVRDGFAFNYGTGGIGAEIIANRLGVGPMRDCVGCKYEEFFLTSWTVGDPAQVVDVPANLCVGDPTCRATEAMYPDDPSNVYHSYLRDHVKFRIMHGGSKEHHIHHQHTHQWLYSPDSDNSAYLDSQALGPGSAFTLDMVYNSSGNRNGSVGDSIFHCHFYPHFAQGMWAMWRVHDVLEDGSRMLPDGEIVQGTPIPGVVPLPGLAMAPMPGAAVSIEPDLVRLPTRGGQVKINGKFVRDMTTADIAGVGNPGFPFWVPGIAGSRPPHPPLDTPTDGGLPRHVLLQGHTQQVQTRLDFTKEIEEVEAIEIAEAGVPVEELAMLFHEQRFHPSYTPEGQPKDFIANGLPRQQGAPFADPCMVENETTAAVISKAGSMRTYKAANIQIDAIFNKAGWHFPQQRIITLWEDVQPTFDGTRAPEPFFFRANSNDCIEFQHTNLVPNVYEMDDFQVRTPTDILGQHIHLVKFDVLASDGSGNGWNYEDGTFSPDEVVERIRAIRAHNGCLGDEINGGDPADGTFTCPVAEAHPYFGAGPGGKFIGAQTTIQRWFADEVLNLNGDDRTLRTVFTHDHYGPSTHQHPGLYAGLVIEPEGSTWRDSETGTIYGGRADGGPTSWRADILTGDRDGDGIDDSFREFLLEYGDFSLMYEAGSHPNLPSGGGPVFPLPYTAADFAKGGRAPGEGYDNPALAVNPPGREEAAFPDLVIYPVEVGACPNGEIPPCPEAISADDPGSMNVNYRNEPIPLRIRDPQNNSQASGDAGDLAMVFRSDVTRADPAFNVQPDFYPPLSGDVRDGDPYTPLLRVYQRDNVQVRQLVGATEEMHNFSINGVKWLFEPSWPSSGFRNSQPAGISEHFEYTAPLIPTKNVKGPFTDYLYAAGAAVDDLWNGTWGIMRSYRSSQSDLLELPNNPAGGPTIKNANQFRGACPRSAPVRKYDVTAVAVADAVPGGTLVYNPRTGQNNEGPINDPTALMYVMSSDLKKRTGQLKNGVPIEPLVLRANAGDCVKVTLRNELPSQPADLDGWRTLPSIVEHFNSNDITPSGHVGMHPQLVAYDASRDDGNNVGFNGVQTASPGGSVTYTWYAGDLTLDANRNLIATPIEFGATNLIPADRIEHTNKGLVASLIIEPQGSTWNDDASNPLGSGPGTRAAATITKADGSSFREFVIMFQNDLNLRYGDGSAIPNTAETEDPEDSGQKAVNYRTEPMWFRMGFAPDMPLGQTRLKNFSGVLSKNAINPPGDPVTPVFWAQAGEEVRFRVLHAGGGARSNVFAVHGHTWQEAPYDTTGCAFGLPCRIGDNPLSWHTGARMGHGPTNHFDAVLGQAGGRFGVTGDYLWRDFASFQFDGGIWGLLRVYP